MLSWGGISTRQHWLSIPSTVALPSKTQARRSLRVDAWRASHALPSETQPRIPAPFFWGGNLAAFTRQLWLSIPSTVALLPKTKAGRPLRVGRPAGAIRSSVRNAAQNLHPVLSGRRFGPLHAATLAVDTIDRGPAAQNESRAAPTRGPSGSFARPHQKRNPESLPYALLGEGGHLHAVALAVDTIYRSLAIQNASQAVPARGCLAGFARSPIRNATQNPRPILFGPGFGHLHAAVLAVDTIARSLAIQNESQASPACGPLGGLRVLSHQKRNQAPAPCSWAGGRLPSRGSFGSRHCRLRSMERRCLPAARALRGRAPDFGTGMKASDRREVGYTRPSGARERGAVVWVYPSALLALAAGLRRALPAPAQGTRPLRIPLATASGPVVHPPQPTQPGGFCS